MRFTVRAAHAARVAAVRRSVVVRRAAVISSVALAAVGVAACSSSTSGSGGTPAAKTSKKLKTIVLGTSSSTVSAYSAAYMAGQYTGCYAKYGYKVELKQMNTPELLLAGLHNGTVDVGIPGSDQLLDMAEEVKKSGDDLPLQAFYEFTYPGRYGLGVQPSSSITSFKQLAGKTVGVDVLTDSSAPFLKALLKSQGVDPSSVKILATGKGVSPNVAMKDGKVQAVYLNDDQFGDILQTGNQIRFVTIDGQRPSVNASGIDLVATKTWLSANPGAAKALTRCTAEGDVFAGANPTAASYIMLKLFPTLATPGQSLTQQVANLALRIKLRQVALHSPDQSVGYGQMNTQEYKNDLTVLLGQSADTLPVNQYFTNKYIKYANDFDKASVIKQAKAFKVPGIKGQVKTAAIPPNAA